MKRIYLLILFSFFFTGYNYAQENIPERPSPERLVNDLGNILSQSEENALEQKLRNYNDTTSTQIAIVTVPSIGENEIADYSNKLANKWGIGQKGKNNGILIFVSVQEHKVRIETGYGMEGVVPDATASTIIQEHIVPNFKNGNFYEGLDKGSDIIIKLASGEYKADDVKEDGPGGFTIFIIIIIVLIIIVMSSRGSGGRGGYTTYSSGGTFFGSGGGFGSSGGGGGFDFGGGSFGGGGASGDW